MGSRTSRAISGRLGVAAALLAGLLVAFSTPALARPPSSPTTFYVAASPQGHDDGLAGRGTNTCTSQSVPCATIAQALTEEGVLRRGAGGAVISLSRGIFSDPSDGMFRTLDAENDGVTISGAGKATQVEPTSCSALLESKSGPDSSPASAVPESAIVNLDGLHGVTIKDMSLEGRGLRAAGCDRTSGYGAAILATGAASGNTIDEVTITADTTYAIQMDGGSQTKVDAATLQPSLCSATLKQPVTGLGSGWKYDQNLVLSKIPRCAAGFSHVVIDGISYAAKRSGSKTVVLTNGPTPPATPSISRRSKVVFDTSVPSYTGVGIACNTLVEPIPAPTSCSISATTVIGGGTVYTSDISPVGILVTNAATASLNDNKVSGNTDSSDNGIGIGLLPDTADGQTAGNTTVGESAGAGTAETLSDNDISILGSAFPSAASSAVWAIDGNTVSANEVGILLTGLTTGSNIGDVSVSSNTVTNTVPGAGIEIADVVATGGGSVTIGGSTPQLGNMVTGNGIGVAVTEGTTSATIENNTIENNVFFGVAVDGADAMPEFLPGLAASDNSFTDNTWTGNGNPVSGEVNGGANIIDFGSFTFPTESIGGSISAQATDLSLTEPIPAGSVPSSITVVKASGFVEMGPGTLVSINGYCAASTFTCVGTNVSFFVTSVVNSPPTPTDPTGPVGNIPVVVEVAPIAPGAAQSLSAIAAGTSVTTNAQGSLTSSNIYSGNSCDPTAPNDSTTLKAGTGGGPSGPMGSQTGYDAC